MSETNLRLQPLHYTEYTMLYYTLYTKFTAVKNLLQ